MTGLAKDEVYETRIIPVVLRFSQHPVDYMGAAKT